MARDPNRIPNDAEIAAINATHLITTPLKPADLLFVFGTRVGAELRADTACRLWREGFYKTVVVSGGITPGDTRSECAIIKAAMVASGVPANIILDENRAMNTGENVIFSLPIIDAAIGLAAIRSVICLGNVWTSRRYPITLHRHWPQAEKMLVVDNPLGVPVGQWHADPQFRRLVFTRVGQDRALSRREVHRAWPDHPIAPKPS